MPDILRTTVDFHSSTDDFSTFVNPDGLSSTTNNQVIGTSVAVVVPIHKVGLTRDELGDDLDWFKLVGLVGHWLVSFWAVYSARHSLA